MRNKITATIRLYLGVIALIVIVFIILKDRDSTLSFDHILVKILLGILVLNYLIYQVYKAILDLKNKHKSLLIMLLLIIVLTGLFIRNLFFVFPDTQFNGIHGFLGASTLLLSIILSIYDIVFFIRKIVKKE